MQQPEQTILLSVEDAYEDWAISPSLIPCTLLAEFARDAAQFLQGSGPDASCPIAVSIVAGSFALRTASPLPGKLVADYARLRSTGRLEGIDPHRARIISRWQKKAKDCPSRRYSLKDNRGSEGVLISASTNFLVEAPGLWVSVKRKIVGTITDMGGDHKPNIHVQANGTTLVISADQELLGAEPLNRLYKTCLVTIAAEENVETGEMRRMRLVRFESYGPSLNADKTRVLREKGATAWQGVDAVVWTRKQRGD